MAHNPRYPVGQIDQVLRACNAAEPLQPGDERWFDFSNLRQARVISRLEKIFSFDEPDVDQPKFHHRLVCGHRGCGKSTDLLRFKAWADAHGFQAERTEVNVHFGQIQLEFSDFFLLAATVAEEALEKLNSPLSAGVRRPIVEWFAEVVKEDKEQRESELSAEAAAQLGGGLPFGLGKLMAKFTSAIKAKSSHGTIVREHMRRYPEQLIDRTNHLLREANRKLSELNRPHGLILIFDNLDRYEPQQINDVLMRGFSLIERLECHAICTIPIDLAYNPRSGPSRDAHGPVVNMPMISLRRPTDSWRQDVASSPYDETAVEEMLKALNLRIDVSKLFESADDARKLVKLSGGCIRDLMHLVTISFETSEGDRLTRRGVEEAIQLLRADYSRQLSQADYLRLADIAARKPVAPDDETLRLLFNRRALEYFDGHKPWLDVHPIIVEIDEFQSAYAKYRTVVAE